MYTLHKVDNLYLCNALGDSRVPTHLRLIPHFADTLALLLHLKDSLTHLSDAVDLAKANDNKLRSSTPS